MNLRKTSALLFIASIALGGSDASAASCGDCNGDGELSVIDALVSAQYSLGMNVIDAVDLEACNLVSDGQVDIMDTLMLAQHAAGIEATPNGTVAAPCDPVDTRSHLEPVVNTPLPAPISVANPRPIEYLISSPYFLDTSVEVSYSLDGNSWSPCTPLYPTSNGARQPTTSVLQIRSFSWDTLNDLPPSGEAAGDPVPVQVKIESTSWIVSSTEVAAGTFVHEVTSEPGEVLILDCYYF